MSQNTNITDLGRCAVTAPLSPAPREQYPETGDVLDWRELAELERLKLERSGPATMVEYGSRPAVAPPGGRHHAPPSAAGRILRRHGSRFASFSVIGGGIFIAGLLLQAALTSGLHVPSFLSYVVQAAVSVEASYFLNRRLTWKAAGTPWLPAFVRYNLQKAVTVSANLVLYGLLVKLGVEYLLANVLLTIVFTFVNYAGADKLVFLRGGQQVLAAVTGPLPVLRQPERRARPLREGRELPSVSVVIPVKGNEKTIRAAVESVLAQDCPLLRELILVGSPGDSTWPALRGIADPRLFMTETETPPGIRDANFKRHLGILQTTGDLVALVDSDMVIPPDWMSTAAELLEEGEADCVAGVMRSVRGDFWGRFVDSNRLGAKTPRAAADYLVTAEAFGAAGSKPPVTANILFKREMYEDCPIDSSWSHGSLEDYEWFWRVVERGHRVLVSGRLFGWHHHRAGFRNLAAEYRRSARGCAYFIRAHRDSPFAQKRAAQAVVLPLAALGVAAGIAAAAFASRGEVTAAALGVAALTCLGFLSAREYARSRTLESLAYPVPALVLGLNYTASLAIHLIRNSPMRATANDAAVPEEKDLPRRRTLPGRLRHPLTFVLALQAGYSLILVRSNAAFGDEALWLWTGRLELAHWLHGAVIPKSTTPLSEAAQVWPVIGALASDAGGLLAARLLALSFMLATTVLVYLITARLFSRLPAAVAAALWGLSEPSLRLAFATGDGMACMLLVLGAWLVLQAAARPRWRGEIIAAAAAVIALGNITAFSFVVYDIFLIPFAFLAWRYLIGTRQAAVCSGWLLGGVGAGTAGLMTALQQWQNALGSTAARSGGLGGSVAETVKNAWSFEGIIFALGSAGALIAIASRDRRRWLLAACALAGWINPAFQARLGTTWSMDKHMAAGVAFLAVPAGYAFTCVTLPRVRAWTAAVIAAAALSAPAVLGMQYARNTYLSWPDVGELVRVVATAQAGSSAPLLVESSGNFSRYLFDYYLMRGDDWQQIQAAGSTPPSLAGGPYAVIVAHFDAAALSDPGLPEDALHYGQAPLSAEILGLAGSDSLVKAVAGSRAYRIYAVVPYGTSAGNDSTGVFVVWVRR
jgi:putative flippase GtrA